MVKSAAPVDEVESSEHESAGSQTETDALRLELETVRTENAGLQDQLKQVKTQLQELSRTNCQCLAQYDELMAQPEAEISRLKGLLANAATPSPDSVGQSVRPWWHIYLGGGKLLLCTHLRVKTLRLNWKTGCQHSFAH